jgi:pyridoxine 4-dehydrogenase
VTGLCRVAVCSAKLGVRTGWNAAAACHQAGLAGAFGAMENSAALGIGASKGIEDNLRSLGAGQLAAVNLRVLGDEPDRRSGGQLAAMIQAREDGLIGGVGLSSITLERLRRALRRTPIACVQNPLNLAGRSSMPVLQQCAARGIAFVPFFPLGPAFAPDHPVLGNPGLRAIAGRLGASPAQVALAWTLGLAPSVLLIPGTSSVAHLQENLAAAGLTPGEQAQREPTAAQR